MIKVKLIDGHYWNMITEYEMKKVEPFYNQDGIEITQVPVYKPKWDEMKDYPEEIIEQLKKKTKEDGTCFSYESVYESAEIRCNEFLEEKQLSKDQIVSIDYIAATEQNGEYFNIVYDETP